MAAVRRTLFAQGQWECDTVADLANVPKEHGTIAYLVDDAVWAIYNKNADRWNTLLLGQVPVAGLDPND